MLWPRGIRLYQLEPGAGSLLVPFLRTVEVEGAAGVGGLELRLRSRNLHGARSSEFPDEVVGPLGT